MYPPILAAVFVSTLGWRPPFYFVGVPAIVMAFVFWRTVKEPESENSSADLGPQLKGMVLDARLIRISLASGFAISVSSVVLSYLPVYLVDVLKQDKVVGASSLILFNIMVIAGNLVFPGLSDRFGRRPVAAAAFAATVPLLIVLPSLEFSFVLPVIALLGLFATSPFTVLTVYVTEIGSQYSRGAYLGLFNTVTTLSSAVALFLAGAASDAFGLGSIFLFLVGISVLGIFTVPKPQATEVGPNFRKSA